MSALLDPLESALKKRPAFVITQAMSAGHYFAIWYRYYAREVGPANIYVITQNGGQNEFQGMELGGVLTYPSETFDDGPRCELITTLARGLLAFYDAGIIVDADEILVPDPRAANSLLQWLERNSDPYVTSIGIDLIQNANDEILDPSKPILAQRRYGYLTSSMCKTSLTRLPVNWGVGFHFASVYPSFNRMFLIHLKRADRTMQLDWLEYMSKQEIAREDTRAYYAPEVEKLDNFYRTVQRWPLQEGWDALYDAGFSDRFFAEVRLDRSGIYRGKHFTSGNLLELPPEFADLF